MKGRAILTSYVGVVIYAAIPFVAAGRLHYWQGELNLVLSLIGTTASHLLSRSGAEQAERRLREAGAGEAWDRRLVGLLFLAGIATSIVAGLDSGRFGWSGPVPAAVVVAGTLLVLGGQLLFAWAHRENDFFSATVRLQSERGHAVCDTGPYRFVRHPGYLGLLLSLLGFPLLACSWWALLPTAAGITLLFVRTRLEDEFLVRALPGYAGYAARTRWRLLPGIA